MGKSSKPGALQRVVNLGDADAQMFRRAVMETGLFQDVFVLVKHADEATRRAFFESQPEDAKERIRELVGKTGSADADRLAVGRKVLIPLRSGL